VTRAALALALLLTTACGTITIDEAGRHHVTLAVVTSISPATVAGHDIGARVTGPRDIIVLPQWSTNAPLIAHELCHAVQWRTFGAGFPITYAKQALAFGYWDAPFEVEARAAESDPWYLAWALDLIGTLE